MPLGARRSEHRVSANSTTWLLMTVADKFVRPAYAFREEFAKCRKY